MRERPILFSGPMVRAILDGRKTQTRRIIKPQPPDHHWSFLPGCNLRHTELLCQDQHIHTRFDFYIPIKGSREMSHDGPYWSKCPFGSVGTSLWVRETWAHDAPNNETCRASHEDALGGLYHPYYRATAENFDIETLKWTPSIHMPRWASRITLKITDIHVERLQDISEGDAIAEGLKKDISGWSTENKEGGCFRCENPRHTFEQLWKYINGPDSWEANPWVWVISFEKVK